MKKQNQKPTPEQIAFFQENGLVPPKNALTAEVMQNYITEESGERCESRLAILRHLHSLIGTVLDDGPVLTYVRIRSTKERQFESHSARKCPFQAHLYKRENNAYFGRPLSFCYKDGSPLWQVNLQPPKVDWEEYNEFRRQLIEDLSERLLASPTLNPVWRQNSQCGPECASKGADIALQWTLDNSPTEAELQALGDEICKLSLPKDKDTKIVLLEEDRKNRIMYYRVKVPVSAM